MKCRAIFIRILLSSSIILSCATTYASAALAIPDSVNNQRSNLNDTMHERIVIIRHAEKPILGLGQLTCEGFNRAIALPNTLTKKYGNPDYLFAPNPTAYVYEPVPYFYVRPLVTLEPFSTYFDADINTKFGFNDTCNLVRELMLPKYHSATIFIAWEHLKIVTLAKELLTKLGNNPKSIPSWPKNDYDSIYYIDIDWLNKKVQFIHDAQNLNGQKEYCSHEPIINPKNTSYAQTLLFIPSAEADDNKLSCVGFNRALALQKVLSADNYKIGKDIDIFLAPNTKYSLNNDAQNYLYSVGIMTLEPSAISQTKPLMCPFSLNETNQLIHYLQKKRFYMMTIAITLPMTLLQQVATSIYKKLGGNVNDLPSDYPNINTIYRFDIVRNSVGRVKMLHFSVFDENISPKTNCSF